MKKTIRLELRDYPTETQHFFSLCVCVDKHKFFRFIAETQDRRMCLYNATGKDIEVRSTRLKLKPNFHREKDPATQE